MKKFICIVLVFILSFGLLGCSNYTTNENDEKVEGLLNYVKINETRDDNNFNICWLVYDKTNMICYDIINPNSSNRIINPHLTVKDGAVYYTLYDNGDFQIAPMAIFTDSMFQMIKGFLN